jgi:hypothetical protein
VRSRFLLVLQLQSNHKIEDRMQTIERFDFFPLTFDGEGTLQSREEFDAFVTRAGTPPAADAVFIAHGFRNDEADATGLYTRFLKTFRAQLARPEFKTVAARRFVFAGVYWPSKPFREVDDPPGGTRGLLNPHEAMAAVRDQLDDLSKDATPAQRAKVEKAAALLPKLGANPKAQDEFVSLVLSLLDPALDKTEGLPQIRKRQGSELLARLSDAPVEGTRGIGDVFNTISGGVGKFLNLAQWYVMKERSGTVGAKGVAAAVRTLHEKSPAVKIHLVGHSLGGRLMASCAKALGEAPRLQPDSLMLLEAAFSHYGFSADNGRGNAGFFRDVVTGKVVKGPFLSTFSAQDTVVGKAYSIVSRLAGDNTREIGDASDEYGGIGRNGPLKTKEVVTGRLHPAGTAYEYQADVINNLDGSGGLIKDHGDVTNDAITYAFASAVART